jgi:voltage-gated potassium channel
MFVREIEEKEEEIIYLFLFKVFRFCFCRLGPVHTPRPPPVRGGGGSEVARLQYGALSRLFSTALPGNEAPSARQNNPVLEGPRMNWSAPKTVRWRFLVAVGHAIHLTWPVLSVILAIQVALGLLIGFVEGWSVGDAVYFTFVTGLTIGYGDVVPRQALGRALAVGIGICGLFLTGLIAGIAVYAMRTALGERDTG